MILFVALSANRNFWQDNLRDVVFKAQTNRSLLTGRKQLALFDAFCGFACSRELVEPML
jgi:hypothetical protein